MNEPQPSFQIIEAVINNQRFNNIVDLTEIFSGVISRSPVSITVADALNPQRPLIFVNDHFTKVTGYTPDEIIGQNCKFLQGQDTNPDDVEKIRHALRTKQQIRVKIWNYKKSGEAFLNDLLIIPVFDNAGRNIAFAGFQVDVTEQHYVDAAAEQNKRLQEMGFLAGGIAHEINNLIQPNLTFPALLRKRLQQDKFREFDFTSEIEWLDIMESHARQTKEIVNNILEFANARHNTQTTLLPILAATRDVISQIRKELPHKSKIDLIEGETISDAVMVKMCISTLYQILNKGLSQIIKICYLRVYAKEPIKQGEAG